MHTQVWSYVAAYAYMLIMHRCTTPEVHNHNNFHHTGNCPLCWSQSRQKQHWKTVSHNPRGQWHTNAFHWTTRSHLESKTSRGKETGLKMINFNMQFFSFYCTYISAACPEQCREKLKGHRLGMTQQQNNWGQNIIIHSCTTLFQVENTQQVSNSEGILWQIERQTRNNNIICFQD